MNVQKMIDYYRTNGGWLGDRKRPERLVPYLADCGSVLDVGCGDGALLAALRQAGKSPSYTGIECVPDHHRKAANRFPDAEWLCADFMEWDAVYITFDAVVACTTFSGDGWKDADIPLAVYKMWALARKRVLIYYNHFGWILPQVCERYGAKVIDYPDGDALLCLEKSAVASDAVRK